MQLPNNELGLYTDFYELTMAQGYFANGMQETPAVFDYFFRKLPFDGGYVIFAGLDELLDMLERVSFGYEEIDYLRQEGFMEDFLEYLKDFRFGGSIRSMLEGEVVFPNEPVLIVEGNIIEVQLVETLILNSLNYPSLIATKASRLRQAAGDRTVLDFGMRRAHGCSAMPGARAAYIGGVDGTSNVLAGKRFDIPVSGTQAHSWIQGFDDELTAFRKFAGVFPDNSILLVDTYNTLHSGVPNAIRVGKEMEARGQRLTGIRLDSGDLAYLSKKARTMLDDAGLEYVKIVASNQLDEFIIQSLNEQKAKVDAFGVGTRLITGAPDASLDGVYKLARSGNKDRLKISENVEKVSLPGRKKCIRLSDENGRFVADAVALEDEDDPERIFHPYLEGKFTDCKDLVKENLLQPVMKNGIKATGKPSLDEMKTYARERLQKLPGEHKRFAYPHIYRVGITRKLRELKADLVRYNLKSL